MDETTKVQNIKKGHGAYKAPYPFYSIKIG